MNPELIVIAGTASNTGKTTLLCDLLGELSREAPWEAIKLTRGHYRSCGKDPHACCVSDLLGEAPTVRSGREETYAFGKDTGRYWDAGAANVHWVIATDRQVEQGIQIALARVQSPGVLIEGTSVLDHLSPSFAVLAVGAEQNKIKASARRALANHRIDAVYTNDIAGLSRELVGSLPVFTPSELPALLARIKRPAISQSGS